MEFKTGCLNDRARAMKICKAEGGTKIRVYPGEPKPGKEGAEIIVMYKNGDACATIPTFEKNKYYGNVKVEGFSGISGSLDGKVSSFEISFGH